MSSDEASRPMANDGGDQIHVGIAEVGVGTSGEELVTNGVGSCLAVALYDETAAVGGLAHPMLPERTGDRGPDAKYVGQCIEQLLGEVVAAGGSTENVVVKLAGGASIFSATDRGIGKRNIQVATASFDELGVPVVGTDLGGEQGRTVALDAASGVVVVKRADGEHLQL